ncbi:MAG: PH domain-containing protein [Acidimicrobiales bacterium]
MFGLLRHARELIPALAAVTLSGVLVLVPIGLGLFVATRYVVWWRTTWSFDGEVFCFDRGVLGRRQQRVPAARIQQVELIRKVRHQALGLATLRMETAGSTDGSEIELDTVDLATAEALRARLLAARDATRAVPSLRGPSASERASEPDEQILRLSARRLALAGMTGAQLLVLAPALGWAAQLGDDVPARFRPNSGSRVPALDELAVAVLAAILVAAILLWVGLAAVTALITNFDLTLSRRGSDLVLRRGLFQRRESVVPVHRIQALRLEQSLPRRGRGMVALRVQSGGSAASADQDRVSVPLLTSGEADRVLRATLALVPDVAALVPAPPAARARVLWRYGLCSGVPAVALVVLFGPLGLTLGAVVVSLALVLGMDTFHSLGHRWDRGVLVTRTGSLMRRTVVVPASRVQSTRVAATVFQSRRDLATLAVDVAGRGRSPRVVDQQTDVSEALATAILSEHPKWFEKPSP